MGSSDDGGGNPGAQYGQNNPMPDLPISGAGGSIDPYNYGYFQNFLPTSPAEGQGRAPSATGLTSEMFQYRSPNGTPYDAGADAGRGALAQIIGKGGYGGIGVGPGGAGGYVGASGGGGAGGGGGGGFGDMRSGTIGAPSVPQYGNGTNNPYLGQTMGANGTPNGPLPTAGYGGLLNMMNMPNTFSPVGGGGGNPEGSSTLFAAPGQDPTGGVANVGNWGSEPRSTPFPTYTGGGGEVAEPRSTPFPGYTGPGGGPPTGPAVNPGMAPQDFTSSTMRPVSNTGPQAPVFLTPNMGFYR